MKLIYISSSTLPSQTANSVHVMRMCESFSKVYDSVELIAKKGKGNFKNDLYEHYGTNKNFSIKLITSKKNLLYSLKAVLVALRKKERVVLYTRNIYAAGILGILNKKVIYEAHTAHWTISKIHRFFFNLFSKNKVNKLVVISSALKKLYQDNTSFSGEIIVAHDGAVDYNIDDSNYNKDKLVVSYIGSLYKGRGVNVVLEAAKELPNYNFQIIGGPNEEKEILEKQYDLKNISFIGYVNPNEIPKYLEESDIFVAPYQKNVSVSGNALNTVDYMSPLKVFEYMASKRPIVISNLPVIYEVLDDTTALFAESDKVEEWVEALTRLSDKELRRKLSTNAYDKFSNYYTWDKRARLIHENI